MSMLKLSPERIKELDLGIQPSVLTQILALDNDSALNFADLEKVIKTDLNLTALIFKVANSSFYSRGNKIETFKHAVALLGFHVIKTISITAASQVLFLSDKNPLFQKYIWVHSLVSAVLAKHLFHEFPQKQDGGLPLNEESVFLGALFHDIGKVVLNYSDRKAYRSVILDVEQNKRSFLESEQEFLGITHVEAGAMAVSVWGLPEYIHKAIEEHELSPEATSNIPLVHFVRAANEFAKKLGFGEECSDDVLKDSLEKIGCESSPPELSQLLKEKLEKDEFYRFFVEVSESS